MGQRPVELTPDKSPTHYWGHELRSLRLSKGLSLDGVGKLIHRDRSYLAKIERGERNISRELAADCDEALGANGTLVRLHDLITRENQHVVKPQVNDAHVANDHLHVAKEATLLEAEPELRAVSEAGEEAVLPARTPDGKVIFVSVPRRLFLKGLGTAALGGTASQAAPIDFTAVPDMNPVEHFQQVRNVLIDSDNLFGPSRIIPTVKEQIQVLQNLRQTHRGGDRTALLELQTKFAEFAGWLHHDIGDYKSALYWTDRALQWSHAARNPELTTFILARKSQLAGDMRDPLEAIEMAEAADSIATANSKLAAVASTFAAHGYALRGDNSESARTYALAHERVESAPASQWAPWLDAAYIEAQKAGSLAALGQHKSAAEEFGRAIATLPSEYRRDKGVYLARKAAAHADARDADEAAALGMQALGIGVETQSGRIISELLHLNSALAQCPTPATKEFVDAIDRSILRTV